MASKANVAHLALHVSAGESIDDERLDQLTRQLRNELQELDVESVELLKEGATPEGTKSVEAVTLGALAVAVLPTAIPQLIAFLQSWLMRGEDRRIKIKTQVADRSLELDYSPSTISPTELKDLVDTLTEALAKGK